MISGDLESIILKLTDEVTLKVIQVLLQYHELTDEQIVNILNGVPNEENEIQEPVIVDTQDSADQPQRIALKEVRRSLYKLNEKSWARYRRVRDKETGYFVYHWSPIWERIKDLVIYRRKLTIKRLKQRLDYEERNLLYICGNNHTPVTFSEAFEMGFRCTCGAELYQKENDCTKKFLKEEINRLEQHINEGLSDTLLKGTEKKKVK